MAAMTQPLTLAMMAVVTLIVGCGALFLLRHRRSRLTAMAIGGPQAASAILSQPPGFAPEMLPVTVSAAQPPVARVSGLGLREAEDLLDWLEQHGHNESTLVCDTSEMFTVEFQLKASPMSNTALQIQTPRSSVG
jgi:hypothetical protein